MITVYIRHIEGKIIIADIFTKKSKDSKMFQTICDLVILLAQTRNRYYGSEWGVLHVCTHRLLWYYIVQYYYKISIICSN